MANGLLLQVNTASGMRLLTGCVCTRWDYTALGTENTHSSL